MNKSASVLAKIFPITRAYNRRLTITLYIIVAFLYWISLYLYVPTLPTYIQIKSDSLAIVGIVLSMYGLWQAIIRLPLGVAADWLGKRKPFIIAGLALSGFGAWLMGVANSTGDLLVGRTVTGLAAGAWVPMVAAFSSLFPAYDVVRAMAILTFVNSVGRMLATGMTGSLNEWGGYSLAFFLAAGAAGLAILFMLPAREQYRPIQRPSVRGIGRLVTRRDVLLPSLLGAVTRYATWATIFGFIPILAKQLGATDITLSMLVSMHIGVVVIGNLLTTVIVNRVGSRRLVYLGFGLLSIGIALAARVPTLSMLFIAQFCIGLAEGTSNPVLMGLSIRYVADAERTTAIGLHQSVYAIGMFAGPWLSGLLASAIGLRPMLGVTAIATLVLGLLGTWQLIEQQVD